MNSSHPMPATDLMSDAELVAATLAGDRAAFGRIVERYQRLLCSLAYSSTGQLSQSEDLAQEAFVEAWRQLGSLREPEKLRSWLCGILRFKVSRLRRSDGREPVRGAASLEVAEEVPSGEDTVADRAMQNEEQAILWGALQRVPETYREPLILYYREHRSVEHVADALELTEDAVKQRLARGRKILQEQVLAFVEGALARSTPGKLFTVGVLAALPEIATPVKAAGLGAAVAAQGGVIAKTTSVAALLISISGFVSAMLTLRANLDQSRTPRERRKVVQITCTVLFGVMGFLGVLWLLREASFRWWESRGVFAVVAQVLVLAAAAASPVLLVRSMRRMRELRSRERIEQPELFGGAADQVGSPASEYKSSWKFLGVPLVHVRYASPDAGERPVFGWFAAGDRAYGLLCAWGGVAVAPVSIGAVSVGLISIGSLSVGAVALGTLGVGYFAVGAMTIAVKAFAWLSALGWHTAQSAGFAIARVAAEGPVAFARYANDPIAREFLANPNDQRNNMIFLTVMALSATVPIALYARAVRVRLGAARTGKR